MSSVSISLLTLRSENLVLVHTRIAGGQGANDNLWENHEIEKKSF
jgi:hypothetical protein